MEWDAGLQWISARVFPDEAPSWERDGAHWPNREASRFVHAQGLRWHVQEMGEGPELLLLHGTGAATHSWRALAPMLASRYTVLAPDLPGHGFTEAPAAAAHSLPAFADALAALLEELGARPSIVVGHSAGAAIACHMCLDGTLAPERVVSLNGALLPLRGWARPLWSPLARAFTWSPLVPRLFACRGRDPDVVARMVRGTGSRLDEEGVRLYGTLLRDPRHVLAALRMMAHWDLAPLARRLPELEPALTLVVGERDRYVPPSEAARVQALLPGAEIVTLEGLGHLAHEESPARVAALLDPLDRSDP